jgi:hypothetical protein
MVLSGLCQDSYIVVRRVQRPVSSCWAVVAPFLPYVPECVGGRLAEKCSTFFLSLGRSRAGSLMGLRAEQRRASRPLEKARCMWRSPEFIGDSSPAASVEGARRGCPAVALQSRVLHFYGRRVHLAGRPAPSSSLQAATRSCPRWGVSRRRARAPRALRGLLSHTGIDRSHHHRLYPVQWLCCVPL